MLVWVLASCGHHAVAAFPIGENRQSGQAATGAAVVPPSVVEIPIDQLIHDVPELKRLHPAASQAALASILEKVGESVASFASSFSNIACNEEVIEQRLTANGAYHDQVSQEFRYLALASPDKQNVEFKEYRADSKGRPLQLQGLNKGYLLTEGFVSAPLYFHPLYQSQSRFRYLGTQVIDKRSTDVVAFAQRLEAREREQIAIGGKSVYVLTQGVAWIDPANYQIIRMRTDLRAPVPEMRLDWQTTGIKFAEVHFKRLASALWLPHEVDVETRCYGQIFRNTHVYSDFKLFSVQTQEKTQEPASH